MRWHFICYEQASESNEISEGIYYHVREAEQSRMQIVIEVRKIVDFGGNLFCLLDVRHYEEASSTIICKTERQILLHLSTGYFR